MSIDPVGLVAFGNMVKGGGLAAIYSPDVSAGWAETSTGWGGLTLAAPTRIKSVSITSAANGFDASGLTTPITIRMYGRVGATPAGPSDWTMLASDSFTDVNAVVTKTLVSADQITLFDHVGFSITSGMWAIATYVQFDEAVSSTLMLPTPDLAKHTVYTSRIDTAIDLPRTFAELPATRWLPLYIPAACTGLVDLTCDFKHLNMKTENDPNGYRGPVGIGWYFGRRFGTTLEAMIAASWQPFPDLMAQCQIASIEHHYGNAARSGAIQLAQGYHQFSYQGTAHTTANNIDGNACLLVENGSGLNNTRLIVGSDPIVRF